MSECCRVSTPDVTHASSIPSNGARRGTSIRAVLSPLPNANSGRLETVLPCLGVLQNSSSSINGRLVSKLTPFFGSPSPLSVSNFGGSSPTAQERGIHGLLIRAVQHPPPLFTRTSVPPPSCWLAPEGRDEFYTNCYCISCFYFNVAILPTAKKVCKSDQRMEYNTFICW